MMEYHFSNEIGQLQRFYGRKMAVKKQGSGLKFGNKLIKFYLSAHLQQLTRPHLMIFELRKSCLDTIERALLNLSQLKTQWMNVFPKPALQKLNSVQNDIQLLKDNFTLIASKLLRLESKCNEKESLAVKVQHKYRVKFEEACEAYKILEVKHQKMGKQLNFIKFSNNNLRSELQSIESKHKHNSKLRKAISEIQRLLQSNGQNLQNNVNKIIATIQSEVIDDTNELDKQLACQLDLKQFKQNLDIQKEVGSVCEFSLQYPLSKVEQITKQEKQVITSCELKTQREQLRTKKKSVGQKQKQSIEHKQTASTQKKKRNQLAKLVQQQSRLSRINQRYLSTDIC